MWHIVKYVLRLHQGVKLRWCGCLEGQTHSEMEGEIAFKVGIEQRIMLSRGFVGRVNGLHTKVETQNEVVEVEP